MAEKCFGNDWVHMFVAEITSRIVAESGIPSDRFHLGKIILQCLKDDPDFVMQIDGATGISETNGSVLKRIIRCTTSLTQMGLKKDDVMVLISPSHLDLAIPFYAGWCLGLAVAPTDRTMNTYDLKHSFEVVKPKIVATNIDPEETIALLISTSGTTGLPKAAALTHKNMAIAGPYVWCFSTKFPSPTSSVLLAAPLQWLSTLLNFVISPIFKYSRVQTSAVATNQHLCELIVGFKPTFMIISPTMLLTLVKTAAEANCDFSNFEVLCVGGSAVPTALLQQIKRMSPKTIVQNTYAMSELGSLAFQCIGAPPGSCGQRNGHLQYRLVDMETKEDIREPNKCGELWLRGPGVFKGYYNNPTATAGAFAEDNWFMTGDLMYRDECWNFYFVDRIKLLVSQQISPVELEAVIHQHPGVLDVAVTGVPIAECGDLPVACVVPRPGCQPTAQEIKELVKENLSDSKQLRGGVLFMSELPVTPSTKLHRRKINEIAMERISELELQTD